MATRFFFIFFLFLFDNPMCFCSEKMGDTERFLKKITQKTSLQIMQKYPEITLVGVGGSVSNDIVNHETMVFDVYQNLDKKRGVNLIREIVEIYLNNISSEKGLCEYLKNNKFTYKNLKIKLFAHTPEGENVYHPDIAFFTLEEGEMYFTTINKSMSGFVSRKKLSYEEAVAEPPHD